MIERCNYHDLFNRAQDILCITNSHHITMNIDNGVSMTIDLNHIMMSYTEYKRHLGMTITDTGNGVVVMISSLNMGNKMKRFDCTPMDTIGMCVWKNAHPKFIEALELFMIGTVEDRYSDLATSTIENLYGYQIAERAIDKNVSSLYRKMFMKGEAFVKQMNASCDEYYDDVLEDEGIVVSNIQLGDMYRDHRYVYLPFYREDENDNGVLSPVFDLCLTGNFALLYIYQPVSEDEYMASLGLIIPDDHITEANIISDYGDKKLIAAVINEVLKEA